MLCTYTTTMPGHAKTSFGRLQSELIPSTARIFVECYNIRWKKFRLLSVHAANTHDHIGCFVCFFKFFFFSSPGSVSATLPSKVSQDGPQMSLRSLCGIAFVFIATGVRLMPSTARTLTQTGWRRDDELPYSLGVDFQKSSPSSSSR